ncbi:MAG: nuclear transport factor 2 family protein [Tepidiformaceae bacterium]
MPLTPEDVLAIQALYARYNHSIHEARGDLWAACFTPDGTFSNARESVHGAEALARYADDFSAAGNARYWINNLVLEATSGGAQGTCYLMLLHVGQGSVPAAIHLTGIYTDTLVRAGGEWKFATRHVERD